MDWQKLPGVLSEHKLFYSSVTGEYECDCGKEFVAETEEDASDLWFAHLADVAKEWHDGQSETEWGMQMETHIGTIQNPYHNEAIARVVYEEHAGDEEYRGVKLVRRTVSEWEIVEESDEQV